MEWIFQVLFGFGLVLKTVGPVFFVDQLENTKKTCKLSFLCVHFGPRFFKRMFLKFNLNFSLNHIVFVYMMPYVVT